MNSLVVLFSLVALVAAKPSELLQSEVLTYAAPAFAAVPAAVSSQSRVDIKSSPAYVATAAVEPIVRTVVSEPAVIAAPVALAAPAAFAAPAALAAPTAIAPAAVSHQSRIDIKSSPAYINSYIASPVTTAAIAPTFVKSAAFAAPAFAYAAPAVYKTALAPEVIAAPSVPLDTPEVTAARFAHFQAKAQAEAQALEGHVIHKRSAPFFAAPAITTYSAAPVVSTYSAPLVHAAPITYAAPFTYHAPLYTKAYSVHPY